MITSALLNPNCLESITYSFCTKHDLSITLFLLWIVDKGTLNLRHVQMILHQSSSTILLSLEHHSYPTLQEIDYYNYFSKYPDLFGYF